MINIFNYANLKCCSCILVGNLSRNFPLYFRNDNILDIIFNLGYTRLIPCIKLCQLEGWKEGLERVYRKEEWHKKIKRYDDTGRDFYLFDLCLHFIILIWTFFCLTSFKLISRSSFAYVSCVSFKRERREFAKLADLFSPLELLSRVFTKFFTSV